MGERIQFDVVKDGDSRTILGCPVTFFDIGSTKAKQFGFTMQLKSGKKFTCVGDEPYNEVDYKGTVVSTTIQENVKWREIINN